MNNKVALIVAVGLVVIFFVVFTTKDISYEFFNSQETITSKLYTNDVIGISFNYPSNYVLEEPTDSGDVVVVRKESKKEYLQFQILNTTPPVPESYKPNNASFIEEVSIDSKKAQKYFTERPVGQGVLENTPFTSYIIPLDESKWINIKFYGSDQNFESILNSLTFTG